MYGLKLIMMINIIRYVQINNCVVKLIISLLNQLVTINVFKNVILVKFIINKKIMNYIVHKKNLVNIYKTISLLQQLIDYYVYQNVKKMVNNNYGLN